MKTARLLVLASAALALLSGCAFVRKPYVFEPQPGEGVVPYYVVGDPYGTATSSCASLTVNLTPVVVGDEKYVRVFLHYANTTDDAFLLHPVEVATLRAEKPDEPTEVMRACSPSDIIGSIERSKNAALFAQALVGAMDAALARPTTVTGPGGSWQIDDTALKIQASAERTAAAMAATEVSSRMLSGAVQRHLLRRHTVFPGSSIAGFIYFPAPAAYTSRGSGPGALSRALKEFRFLLAVDTPCGVREFEFLPVEGE